MKIAPDQQYTCESNNYNNILCLSNAFFSECIPIYVLAISIKTSTSLKMNIEQCLVFKKISLTNFQDIEWRENENMENADALGP